MMEVRLRAPFDIDGEMRGLSYQSSDRIRRGWTEYLDHARGRVVWTLPGDDAELRR